VLGLDISTVSEALAIRALEGDDREMAVAGWFTPPPMMVCRSPIERLPNPLIPWCQDGATWLTEEPEVLLQATYGSLTVKTPIGPSLNPFFDTLNSTWKPPLPKVGDSQPADVVVVGHFDDRRARLCPADVVDKCRDRFVVDRVVRADGEEQPLSLQSLVDGPAPRDSLEEILAIVAKESPESEVLSVVTADRGSIGRLEPELTVQPSDGADPLTYVPIKWVVRVLDAGRVETYVVWDDTDIIWQMTRDRGPVQVGGSIGMPEDPFAWPPLGSIVVVDLTSEVGAGRPAVEVAVIDQSGRLNSAGEGASPNLEATEDQGWFNAYPEPGSPGRVHLSWVGSLCDARITVTVAEDVRSVTLDTGPYEDCDTLAVGREIVLDFSGVVDVPSIDLLKTVTVFN
jgi:hypothetical protein